MIHYCVKYYGLAIKLDHNCDCIKYAIVDAMKKYGGSFVAAMGNAWQCADPENRAKLEETFDNYFEEYRKFLS